MYIASNGAGLYGYEPGFSGHKCGKCANPFTGGNEACPNNRPSQYVPYLEEEEADE